MILILCCGTRGMPLHLRIQPVPQHSGGGVQRFMHPSSYAKVKGIPKVGSEMKIWILAPQSIKNL